MGPEDIIELYNARSEDALSETDKKYGKYCGSIAFGILRDKEEAKECVNDTYLRAWEAIPPAHPENLKTFLGKITRNLAINRIEKLSAKKRGGSSMPAILEELGECIPSENTEHITEDMVIRDVLRSFVSSLPEDRRKMFVLRYWYMSSEKEIAKKCGVPENRVSVALFRMRKELKELLEKEGISV